MEGYDLVGDENALKPLIDYVDPLLRFRQRVTDLGLDIPFIFHAGETLGDGTKADNNLYDAILLGTKRIGHGYVLAVSSSQQGRMYRGLNALDSL
jgi:adenosine deaminase CECR1